MSGRCRGGLEWHQQIIETDFGANGGRRLLMASDESEAHFRIQHPMKGETIHALDTFSSVSGPDRGVVPANQTSLG
jgi:hypothetical protein